MSQLTLAEQTRIARLAAERASRGAAALVLSSRLLRWRYGAPVADELLIIPQDLRTADTSFATEIEQGHFGLAGRVASLVSGSPFDLRPPTQDWERELHGFGWLRHLKAANQQSAIDTALLLTRTWIERCRSRTGVAWEPAVVGRRLISWITNAGVLLDNVDQAAYDLTTDSLADQLVHLSAIWRDAPDGYQRLLALIALGYGDLCVAGHERQLRNAEAMLAQELDRQILPDGGHLSRNPALLVELLLDLLPLRQCFATRQREVPVALEKAISRMMPMVRFMRLGDGTLARFNGAGAPSIDLLATAIAYDSAPNVTLPEARSTNYVRMERGAVVLIADVGSPPPFELAGQAKAGCLSFELSVGTAPVFVNGGSPGPAEDEWRALARSTASHNTLSLGGKSSSKLVRHPLVERLVGAAPIRFPDQVTWSHQRNADGDLLDAAHDGYMRVFQMMHRRRLALTADGRKLAGLDTLGPRGGQLRLAQDVPFAIHFHLDPEVQCERDADGRARVDVSEGEAWVFSASGAQLSIEPSVHFADLAGPARSLQIVLRGACWGETEVRWWFEREDGC